MGPEQRRKCHRVAHLFFDDAVIAGQMADFAESSHCLEFYVALYSLLLCYALAPFVERNVEAEHARIKSALPDTRNILPSLACARIRFPDNKQVSHPRSAQVDSLLSLLSRAAARAPGPRPIPGFWATCI